MAKRVVISEKPGLSAATDITVLGQFVRYKRTSLNLTLEDAASL